ncbi:MAG: ABC transporter ATP-binding protein [Deltaproteobacteria bacterium]|jgi:peptide/nickel transport system ATP-binding protein|nr:ABC transporter ATP-binding protein [Deltaproteobacteria bacterium]
MTDRANMTDIGEGTGGGTGARAGGDGAAGLGGKPGERETIIRIDKLSIGYETESGYVKSVRGVSLGVRRRESFGLVGESGSGKSTLALGSIRYLAANGRVTGGSINFMGRDITTLGRAQMSKLWGRHIGMVYQNPSLALNPSIKIGRQIAESAQIHQGLDKKASFRKAVETMGRVSMPDPEYVAGLYPHQLSGGMLQRCVITMALLNTPSLLVMDEPTTALDVTTQAVVLDLVASLKKDYDSAVFYITHDLAVVARICDSIGVMYAGELMESGPAAEIFRAPRHPYTLSLLNSIPKFEEEGRKKSLRGIDGMIPSLRELPRGCVFSPRCFMAVDECRLRAIEMEETAPGHLTACHRWRLAEEMEREIRKGKSYPAPEGTPVSLSVDKLSKHYAPVRGALRRGAGKSLIKALNSVTLSVPKGCTLGVVGESGCGKTTLLRSITGLLEPTSGEVALDSQGLPASVGGRPRSLLRRIQMVFQNPDASLNPNQTVAKCIERPLKIFSDLSRAGRREKILEILESVNLPSAYYNRLPGELSGGELQRVGIARAFAAEPDVILLDEPLSALDVSVQATLVNLLLELQVKNQPSYLFISHDLAAVHHISDLIAVMYLGRVVEFGKSEAVFKPPFHPYTEALLSAVPNPDPDAEQVSVRLEGSVPSPSSVVAGCAFHSRCPRVRGPECSDVSPPARRLPGSDAVIFCHIPLEELSAVQSSPYHRTG